MLPPHAKQMHRQAARMLATAELSSSALTTNAARQLHVLGHDGHALGMDGAEVCVLKEAHKIALGCLLQCHDGAALKAQVCLVVLSNLTHKALEGQLANEELCRLLVLPDLTANAQAHMSRLEEQLTW